MENENIRAFLSVDLSAAERNFQRIQKKTGRPVIAVVKADAYGHGAVALGRLFEALGARRLAVATLAEAEVLRQGGVECPILILGETPPTPDGALALFRGGFVQTLVSPSYGKALLCAARAAGVPLGVEGKVDTGMGRIGFLLGEEALLPPLLEEGSLRLLGLFTHFYKGEEEEATREQCRIFDAFRGRLSALGIPSHALHAAASSALHHPFARYGAVRPGLALYGLGEGGEPLATLYARCIRVKRVKRGATLSYGGTRAERDMTVATLSVGYGDGFLPPGGHCVWVGDAPCPVLGRVCMDMTLIDVSRARVREGDVLPVLTGRDLLGWKTEDRYRACVAITARVPRKYATHGTKRGLSPVD